MDNRTKFLFTLVKTNTSLARRLSGHGLDFTDFMILSFLDDAPDKKLRRVDLADCLGLTASGITRMLLPLEKLRIIERENDDLDARARYASLTKAGQELLRDARASLEMKLDDIMPEASDKKLKEFISFLQSIEK